MQHAHWLHPTGGRKVHRYGQCGPKTHDTGCHCSLIRRLLARQMVENTLLLRMQDGQPLEAVIMAGLAHPQVVHTIAHLMVRAPSNIRP